MRLGIKEDRLFNLACLSDSRIKMLGEEVRNKVSVEVKVGAKVGVRVRVRVKCGRLGSGLKLGLRPRLGSGSGSD